MTNIINSWQPQVILSRSNITDLTCSKNGRMIVCGGGNSIMIYDPRNGQLKNRFSNQYIDSMDHLRQLIASSNNDHVIRIWNIKGKLVKKHILLDSVSALSFSPDENILAVGLETMGVQVINTKSEIRQLQFKHDAYISYICYSPDGQQLVVAYWDLRIYILDSNKGNILQQLDLDPFLEPLPPIKYSPDGQFISACTQHGTIIQWKALTGGILNAKIQVGDNICINTIAYSPDGKYLCSGQDDSTIGIWNIDKSELSIFQAQKPIIDVSFSSDSQFLVSTSQDNKIMIQQISQAGQLII